LKSTNAIEIMNDGIRRIKITSSFPNMDSAMKIFYYKLREYNSKHAFRKINEMFNERYSL
jgi:transposase-like protein